MSLLPRVLGGLLLLGLLPPTLQAQDENARFSDFFSSYLGDNAQGYLRPMGDVLSASLNAGLFRPVPPEEGFSVQVGLDLPSSFIGDDQKVFQATTEPGFFPETTTDAPTIVGAAEPKMIDGEGELVYVFPAGLAIERVTLIVPRLTVGFSGTEVTGRFYAQSLEDIGDISLLGLGLRHNISRYLPPLPVDLGIGVLYHTVEFADVTDLTALLVSAQASVTRGPLGFYGGLGYGIASMGIHYTNEAAENDAIDVELDDLGGIRATAGVALELPVLALYADVTAGPQTVVNVGLALGY